MRTEELNESQLRMIEENRLKAQEKRKRKREEAMLPEQVVQVAE